MRPSFLTWLCMVNARLSQPFCPGAHGRVEFLQ